MHKLREIWDVCPLYMLISHNTRCACAQGVITVLCFVCLLPVSLLLFTFIGQIVPTCMFAATFPTIKPFILRHLAIFIVCNTRRPFWRGSDQACLQPFTAYETHALNVCIMFTVLKFFVIGRLRSGLATKGHEPTSEYYSTSRGHFQ